MGKCDAVTMEDMGHIVALVREQYGYDFGNYAHASLQRRLQRILESSHLTTVAAMLTRLKTDPQFFTFFLQSITVNVTEMFRDPLFYAALREKVLPKLATYPVIKIWHAGCASGEEVFSMAIMLHEAGLLDRARIYATDLNPANLEKARKGIIAAEQMKDYTANYIAAGGQHEFSSYYTARYDHAIIQKSLRNNIIFSQHNLVTDQVFNEFQLVCCRNVLIYFNKELQSRALHLFHDSLAPLGYLALGNKESLLFTDVKPNFEVISNVNKIYRRKSRS